MYWNNLLKKVTLCLEKFALLMLFQQSARNIQWHRSQDKNRASNPFPFFSILEMCLAFTEHSQGHLAHSHTWETIRLTQAKSEFPSLKHVGAGQVWNREQKSQFTPENPIVKLSRTKIYLSCSILKFLPVAGEGQDFSSPSVDAD